MTFTPGGAVSLGGTYIVRAADDVVLSCLSSFQSCYLFHPRQSGKSSLRRRTAALLRSDGFAVVEIDLTIGSRDPIEKLWRRFERGIAFELGRLGHEPLPSLSDGQDDLTDGGLDALVNDKVFSVLRKGLILFIDEVNVLGMRDDRDEILSSLRALIARQIACAVCLIGVAQTSDLPRSPESDPFPLMRMIELDDFSRDEINTFKPLLRGFTHPNTILDACYEITSGHPYMLQNVLALAVETKARVTETHIDESKDRESARSFIRHIVDTRFFRPESDPILGIPEHIFGSHLDPLVCDALNLFRTVLSSHGATLATGEDVGAQETLRLAGMVRIDNGNLVVRNEIFARRYDLNWVRDKLDRPIYETMATLWRLENKHPDFLLRGKALGTALELLDARTRSVSSSVADYIQASAKTSAEPGRAVLRARRAFTTVLAVLIVGLIPIAIGLLKWKAAEDAADEAAKQSLHAKLETVKAQLASTESLLANYERQIDDSSEMKKNLEDRLGESASRITDLKKQRDDLEGQISDAVRNGNHANKSVEARLKTVKVQLKFQEDQSAQLGNDLIAARSRESEITSSMMKLRDQVGSLNKEKDAAGMALEQEIRRGAELTSQLAALREQINKLTEQLEDADNHYKRCTEGASKASFDLEERGRREAACNEDLTDCQAKLDACHGAAN